MGVKSGSIRGSKFLEAPDFKFVITFVKLLQNSSFPAPFTKFLKTGKGNIVVVFPVKWQRGICSKIIANSLFLKNLLYKIYVPNLYLISIF